jgi:molybdate transport system ATP-binding protein
MSAPLLRIDVRKRLEGVTLDARLTLHDEALVLFGPSGAGKTSLLNVVAGLLRPDAGTVELAGRVLERRAVPGPAVHVPARNRGIGYVMQDYALFPHMSALENVRYPIRRRADSAARARALLERVSLLHLADIEPARLSGGQQQRVAIARALARAPRLLLLDEPFAALDRALRERLHHDIRTLRRESGIAIVLVTHRLEDAFAIGDRLAVMRHGTIEQVGAAADVFRRPASRGIAEVLGIRNVFRARIVEATPGGTVLDWEGLRLDAPPLEGAAPAEVNAYIRPDDIKIVYPDRPLAPSVATNIIDARVVAVRSNAAARELQVELANGQQVEIRAPPLSYLALGLEPGVDVRVSLRREGVVLLGA